MNPLRQIIFITLFSLLTVSGIQAVTHEVYPDSGLSIQATVLAASNGDSILIHEGVYTESVVLYGKGLTIYSEYMFDRRDSTHITNTVIQADTTREDTMSCFVYAYGEHPRGKLSGLTLTNGRGTYSTITGHIAGGGVYVYDSSIQMENCRILDCRAYIGGGIAIRGRESHPEIQQIKDCVLRDCFVGLAGGGIHAHRCSLLVNNCEFYNNSCLNAGAGAYITSSYAEVKNTQFISNSGALIGGLFFGDNTGLVSNCIFNDNSAIDDIAHFEIIDSEASVTRCLFGSTASQSVSLSLSNRDEPLRFFGNIIENNLNRSNFTGTILIALETNGEFAYNVVRNNLASNGCAFYTMSRSSVNIHHNLIENNISDNPDMPSVLFAINEAQPSLDSNVIRNNNGQTMRYDFWQPQVIDARNNWWGHESGPYHPTLNPDGQGDTLLSNMVDFIPWLTEPPDTTMPSGLDPDPDYPAMPGTWHIMNLFPNPFNSEFTIILAGFTRQDFSIRLYDILGREAAVVYEGALTGGSLTFVAPADLASGVYFLRALDKQVVDTRKVVFLK